MKYFLMSFTLIVGLATTAKAIETYEIVIEDHKFTPAEITVPADTRVKLIVENRDDTAEEFESNDFHREKIIAGKSRGTIFIPPLDKGEYKFFGEFNPETAQGMLKVE